MMFRSKKLEDNRYRKDILRIYGKEPETLDEIAEAVRMVASTYCKVIGFSWKVRYLKKAPSSHAAPVEGYRAHHRVGPGYEGFYGRVWIRYAWDPDHQSDMILRRTLTYPGSGGGGGYGGPWAELCSLRHRKKLPKPHCYSWDYTFYIDDWPALRKTFEQERIMNLLKSDTTSLEDMYHEYDWQDEETFKKDEKFILGTEYV
jgi:hypothetical protein